MELIFLAVLWGAVLARVFKGAAPKQNGSFSDFSIDGGSAVDFESYSKTNFKSNFKSDSDSWSDNTVNPTTGLPMVENAMIDVGGNVFGAIDDDFGTIDSIGTNSFGTNSFGTNSFGTIDSFGID